MYHSLLQINNKYNNFLVIYQIKQSVISDSIAVKTFEFTLQLFNIGAKIRVVS
jgi:hypothetical protein